MVQHKGLRYLLGGGKWLMGGGFLLCRGPFTKPFLRITSTSICPICLHKVHTPQPCLRILLSKKNPKDWEIIKKYSFFTRHVTLVLAWLSFVLSTRVCSPVGGTRVCGGPLHFLLKTQHNFFFLSPSPPYHFQTFLIIISITTQSS